ncbi:MAG: endolytic transglycosylase MltG [Oscillospiraceae bacterium]|nr:endolytic transglycosylase MltG [Oscillospiraceae bacterium]
MAEPNKPIEEENNEIQDEVDAMAEEILNADKDSAAETEPTDAPADEETAEAEPSAESAEENASTEETAEKSDKPSASSKKQKKHSGKAKAAAVVKAAAENAASDEDDDEEDDDEDFGFYEGRKKSTKKRKKRRVKRKKGRGVSCALILLTLIFSLSVTAAVTILALAKEMYGIDKDITEKVITIPEGSTSAMIAQQLQDEDMIRIPKLFQVFSRLNGMDGSYIAGEHVISPSMSYEAMIYELCSNHTDDRDYVRVTFKEGQNLLECAEILEENGVCKKNDFIFYFNAGGYNYKFEEYLPEASSLKFYAREGYCFPDTYEFYVDEDPQIVVQKIYANFDSKFTAADYKAMESMNMTLDEVVTLASIVQAEAPTVSSMRMVSSVFHNRLNMSGTYPRLESDPTRIYAEDVIAPNLSIKNEIMCNAYNTYQGNGLPPGAINNPGKEAISAVLRPEETQYYFFCANTQTGEIFYAQDNAGHEANLEAIRLQQAQAALADNGDGNGNG